MMFGLWKRVDVQIRFVAAVTIIAVAPHMAQAGEPGSGLYAADCGKPGEGFEVEIFADGTAAIAKDSETYAGLLASYSFFGKATPPDFHIAVLFGRDRSPLTGKAGRPGWLEIWKGEAAYYALPNGDREKLLYFCADVAVVAPKGPAFDCGAASGPVETLICGDTELARRDWALAAVYRKALGRVGKDETDVRDLAADQAEWVRKRNDCQAAKDMRACVATRYAERHAMLLARFGLMKASRTQIWVCGEPDRELHVTDFMTEPPTINLAIGGRTVTAILRRSGSGSRYEAPNGVEFWIKGAQAQLIWPQGTRNDCRYRGPL